MFWPCCKFKTKTSTRVKFEIKSWNNWTPGFKDNVTLAISKILIAPASALPGFVFNLFSLMLAYRTKLLIKSPYVSTTPYMFRYDTLARSCHTHTKQSAGK